MNSKLALAIKSVFVIIGLLLIFRALDLLMAWSIYSWIFQPIYEQGVPEQIAGIIAVWFTSSIVIFGPTVLFDLIVPNIFPELVRNFLWKNKRHYRRAIYLTATCFTVWFALMYAISRPGDGELFNKITGEPWYVYSTGAKGEIILFPKGVRYNPLTGEAVSPLTTDVATKGTSKLQFFQTKQRIGSTTEVQPNEVSQTTALSSTRLETLPVFESSNNVKLWVEKVDVLENDVRLHLAAENSASVYTYLRGRGSDAYLIGTAGNKYETNNISAHLLFNSHISVGEIFRFSLSFSIASISEGKQVKLYYPYFPPILIDLENETAGPVGWKSKPVPESSVESETDKLLASWIKGDPVIPQPQIYRAPLNQFTRSVSTSDAVTPFFPPVLLYFSEIEATEFNTKLYLAVQAVDPDRETVLCSPRMQKPGEQYTLEEQFDTAYIADEEGNISEFISDQLTYQNHKSFQLGWTKSFVRHIRPNEKLSFWMEFGSLKKGVQTLKFFHRQFGHTTINLPDNFWQ